MALCNIKDCLGKQEYKAIAAVNVSPGCPPIIIDLPVKVCAAHKTIDLEEQLANAETWGAICEGLREMGFPRDPDHHKSVVAFIRIEDKNESKWAKHVLKPKPKLAE